MLYLKHYWLALKEKGLKLEKMGQVVPFFFHYFPFTPLLNQDAVVNSNTLVIESNLVTPKTKQFRKVML